MIELLVVIAIIAVLIGLLLPAVNSAREAAVNQKMQQELGTDFCGGLHSFFKEFGIYPSSLDDPRLLAFMPGFQSPESLAGSLDFTLGYTVHPGTPGNESTWDFELCASKRQRPLVYCTDKSCAVINRMASLAQGGASGGLTEPAFAQAAETADPCHQQFQCAFVMEESDLTPVGNVPTGPSMLPFGACSDGINFWITLSFQGQLARL